MLMLMPMPSWWWERWTRTNHKSIFFLVYSSFFRLLFVFYFPIPSFREREDFQVMQIEKWWKSERASTVQTIQYFVWLLFYYNIAISLVFPYPWLPHCSSLDVLHDVFLLQFFHYFMLTWALLLSASFPLRKSIHLTATCLYVFLILFNVCYVLVSGRRISTIND